MVVSSDSGEPMISLDTLHFKNFLSPPEFYLVKPDHCHSSSLACNSNISSHRHQYLFPTIQGPLVHELQRYLANSNYYKFANIFCLTALTWRRGLPFSICQWSCHCWQTIQVVFFSYLRISGGSGIQCFVPPSVLAPEHKLFPRLHTFGTAMVKKLLLLNT